MSDIDVTPVGGVTNQDPSAPAPRSERREDVTEHPKYRQLLAERDHYKAESDRLSRVAKDRSAELTQFRREIGYAKAWHTEAAKAGLRPEAIDDAWRLSGYKPEKDEPDVKALSDVLKGLKESRPYLFMEKAEPQGEAQPEQGDSSAKPFVSPGLGRVSANGSGHQKASLANHQDVRYVMGKTAKEHVQLGIAT